MKQKSAILISVLFLLSSLVQAQQKSLLWEVSGNGLAKPSYIYGTMHVSDRVAFHLSDSFFIAIKSVDIIALESNPETWIENDYGRSESSNTNSYNDYYDYSSKYSDFYTRSTEIEIPDVKVYNEVLSDNTNLVNGYLYRYNDHRGDYAEDTYLDLFIFQCGKKLNKQIAALEGEQEVLRLLQKAYQPDEDADKSKEFIEQRKIISELTEDGTSIYDQIDDAYRNGDLDRLDSLEQAVYPSQNFKKYFIEERNRNMVRRMDSIIQSGKTVFTGIGAAHLPGEYGALKLLEAMGYTVTPVKGKISGKSIKEKNKIDALQYSHALKKYFSDDSSFSVSSPGKLYNIPVYDGNEFYLYPDMANSAYYVAIRLKHRAAFKNMTSNDIFAEIDKMLFENIPGDIQSKTSIRSNTGLPGFDIVSKTKRGNFIRFNIFVSPIEIIVFKVGGIGDFVVKSKEVQSYFSDIKFSVADKNTWSTYEPAWGLFSVSLPETRVVSAKKSGESTKTAESICSADALDDNGYYVFSSYLYNDDEFIEEDSFELLRITDMFIEQFKKNKFEKTESEFLLHEQYPSLESKFSSKDDYLFTKVVIKGPYYFFMAALSDENKFPENYFNSLQLKDFKYNAAFEIYTDTALDFTVKTIVPALDTLLSYESIDYGYDDYGYSSKKNKEVIDKSYLSKSRYKVFKSEETPENIMVSYYKYHKFESQDDKEKFLFTMDSAIMNSYGMFATRKKIFDSDTLLSFEFLLTDTASTRGIYQKVILKDDVIFGLSTCIDTIAAPSAFVRNFYDTFAASDSVNGASIFESRADLFFSQLKSTDSVLSKQSVKSIQIVELKGKDADSLISYMQTPAFKKLELETREFFIDKLASIEHESVLPAMRKFYMDAGDTSTLQLAVLHGLISMKSKESIKVFNELLYLETPLAKKGGSLSWVFTPLYDSLDLAVQLFPQIYNLTTLPEYQYAIYKMLALISKNPVGGKDVHETYKKQIIAGASAELKRFMAAKESESTYSNNSYSNKTSFTKLKDITDGNSYDSYNSYSYDDYDVNYNYNKKKTPKNYSWATTQLDYYTILLSEYYEDPAVQNYFQRIYKSKDNGLIYRSSLTLAANKLPVPDSVWNNLVKHREWRYTTVKQLQTYKMTPPLDSTYLTQEKIAEGCLFQYEFKDTEDSIVYLGKEFVQTKKGDGYIYFFKSKMGSDKAWNLDCIGIQPSDTSKFEIEPLFVNFGSVILDDEDLKEKMDEIIKSLELLGRQRVHLVSDNQNYNNYYDY